MLLGILSDPSILHSINPTNMYGVPMCAGPVLGAGHSTLNGTVGEKTILRSDRCYKNSQSGYCHRKEQRKGETCKKSSVEATSELSWEQDLHPRWVCLPALQGVHRDNGGKGILTKAVMNDCLNLAQISSPLPKISTHHFC